MQHPSKTVYAIVLAAGRSVRFGATKQIVELDGVPLLRRALDAAAEVCGDRVITVLGHDDARVFRSMQTNSGFLFVNDAYDSGMGSSIASAARLCPLEADALLLLLADQVLVTPGHLQALLQRWSGAPAEIVATAFEDTQGPPVLLPRETFDDLCQLNGDSGARALFQDARFRLKTVRFEDAAVDIDTRSDLAALT